MSRIIELSDTVIKNPNLLPDALQFFPNEPHVVGDDPYTLQHNLGVAETAMKAELVLANAELLRAETRKAKLEAALAELASGTTKPRK